MRDVIAWDNRAHAVTASRQKRLARSRSPKTPLTGADPEQIADAMTVGVRGMVWRHCGGAMPHRVSGRGSAFSNGRFPDEPWPDLSDVALTATLDGWLKPYLAGMTRKSHLDRLDKLAIMRGRRSARA